LAKELTPVAPDVTKVKEEPISNQEEKSKEKRAGMKLAVVKVQQPEIVIAESRGEDITSPDQ